MHVDCTSTRKQFVLKFTHLLIGKPSKLSKLTPDIDLYKSIFKLIWTTEYSIWEQQANSNIEILQRFQNKVLETY